MVSSRLNSADKSGEAYSQLYWPGLIGGGRLFGVNSLMKTLGSYLRTFMVFASKVWTFICFVFKKQTRAVSKSVSRNLMQLWWGCRRIPKWVAKYTFIAE